MKPESKINDSDPFDSQQYKVSREQLKVTLSFGVTKWQQDMNFETAVSRADQALYESKRLGRDRVTYFD